MHPFPKPASGNYLRVNKNGKTGEILLTGLSGVVNESLIGFNHLLQRYAPIQGLTVKSRLKLVKEKLKDYP
mgnify:CR=1 FL=1